MSDKLKELIEQHRMKTRAAWLKRYRELRRIYFESYPNVDMAIKIIEVILWVCAKKIPHEEESEFVMRRARLVVRLYKLIPKRNRHIPPTYLLARKYLWEQGLLIMIGGHHTLLEEQKRKLMWMIASMFSNLPKNDFPEGAATATRTVLEDQDKYTADVLKEFFMKYHLSLPEPMRKVLLHFLVKHLPTEKFTLN